ncbi:unnamed protein product [Rotaria socialis]|uniref:Serpin domain-containing protein n=1 Tax=Rotaria socialis TaxID=392032 RepID=A0A819BGI6_9BILA|nr:unnamed protein product [Rotaria socialis]
MKDILWILCKTIVRICVAGILIYSAVSSFILPWISLYFPSEKMHETDTSQLEYSSSFNGLDTDSIILSSPSTAADLEHFGYELFSNVSQQQNGTNIFLSPTSIALALSMCIAGARDETLNQALRVLHASSIEALTKTVEQIMHMISMTAHNKKGIWKNRFPEILTKKADFYEANGHISKIDVMFQTGKYAYAENNDLHAQIAHLPYQSDNENIQFAFTVILPKQDISLDEVERKLALQPDLMQLVLSDHNTSMTELLLYLPKFKMKASLKLDDVLKQLGMENAFNSTANFTGITSQQDGEDGIFISEVIHKAFIDVNEQGTKAAAATAGVTSVLFSATALKPMPILFKADRPFLFFIRESRQNIVLFSGKLVSPPSAL